MKETDIHSLIKKPLCDTGFSAIYFLFSNDILVYVGQTTCDVIGRVVSHSKEKQFDSYSFLPCPKEFLNKMESYFIVRHSPKYNLSVIGYHSINAICKEYERSTGIRLTLKERRTMQQTLGGYTFNGRIVVEREDAIEYLESFRKITYGTTDKNKC